MLKLLRSITMSMFLDARAVASSPSPCERHCMAVGATPRGMLFLCPKILMLVSMDEMSRSTRGRMRYFWHADAFCSELFKVMPSNPGDEISVTPVKLVNRRSSVAL